MIKNVDVIQEYDKLLTPKHLSEYLQIKVSTVYKWTHYGYVPYIKVGGSIRFNRKQIDTWLKKKEKRGRLTYNYPVNDL